MTTKGEAIALAIAMMSSVEIATADHGLVAKIRRVLMERDIYPRRWGLGPVAGKKKQLKAEGKLDKYGRANENTPSQWKEDYLDYGGLTELPSVEQLTSTKSTTKQLPGLSETTSKKDVLSAPPVAPGADVVDTPMDDVDAEKSAWVEDDEDDDEEGPNGTPAKGKKGGKHEGETAEERAERKKRKAEKKAKKAAKAAKKSSKKTSDSD